MKRITLLVLMLVLLGSVVVEGKEAGTFEIVGGAKVAKLDYTLKINGSQIDWTEESQLVIDDLSKPAGFYLGGIYWLDDNKGIELGASLLESSFSGKIDGEEVEKRDQFLEFYGKYNYRINQYFKLNGGFTYSSFKEEDKIVAKNFDQVVEEGSGFGLNAGGGMTLPITDSLVITGEFTYSLLNILIDKSYDQDKEKLVDLDYDREYIMNPLSAKLGISYRF
ncbi:outer membrane beta-barrel protein [Orenia marismortui]|uniref:outer membrane beta-barrel protein n=1 Tax=Orenia marismortui TaxID=46469 RepID=UPI000361BD95|nr:outer membrane beta-barrel protein [Orenia marismortui]